MKRDERDAELQVLIDKIAREFGFGCDAYKASCLRRRVAVRMRAHRVTSYDDYARLLDSDSSEYERLLDTLTINVTKFFRNRETWSELAERVIPPLWEATEGHVRCWSAGCASGEEPYTLGILLAEHARRAEAELLNVSIDATDYDRASLKRASAGRYSLEAFEEMPAELARRYFENGEIRTLKSVVRNLVQFHRHDVTRDPPLRPSYDLIICRNVLIYFDRENQARILDQFINALRPHGYLILGKAETLPVPTRARLDLENARERIYKRR